MGFFVINCCNDKNSNRINKEIMKEKCFILIDVDRINKEVMEEKCFIFD